jgi:GntR family transcriptional repressor for pyruvate dehydrogenase complex
MIQISDMLSQAGANWPCVIPLNCWQKPWTNENTPKTHQPQTHFRSGLRPAAGTDLSRGDFQPGEKIMTERELAEALNVSRNSVREAINKLVTLRFLEQRQGQGTFVRSMDEAVKIPLATVMEPRMRASSTCWKCAWESSAMPLRWPPSGPTRDLEAIEKALREMDADTRAGGLGTEGDLSFHMAIAMATKNPLQIYIMKNVSDFPACGHPGKPAALYQTRITSSRS